MDESRRSLIKKAALGAGVIWTTAVLRSAALPAIPGTPGPCDCAHPATPPKTVACGGDSACFFFFCEAVISPCDTVEASCAHLSCSFTFTASCSQTRTGHTGGTITSAVGADGLCSHRAVGETVEFDYAVN
jgi:hypothetical protein